MIELKRKFENTLEQHFNSDENKILIIEGARQVGKSYLVRRVGKKRFKNYVEINLADDKNGPKIYEKITTTDDLYLQISIEAKGKLGTREDTLVFLDEIQEYPHLLTVLKFLREEGRFTYIASGSSLGIALKRSTSIPIGSIMILPMFPLDFEEFLWAAGCGEDVIETMRKKFKAGKPLSESLHLKMMDFFRRYLLSGGLPDAVKKYLGSQNMYEVRKIQSDIHDLYGVDASKYDEEHKLKIRRIYQMIPSMLENKKKRMVVKDIEQKPQARYSNYADEFEYLISSGIALDVKAVSNPRFPLSETETKNLMKLYLNDVGLLTNQLYKYNINAVMNDEASVNLGSVYECAVAGELRAHGHSLFYYDNKAKGEVDFLVDDYDALSVLPIEVKSGKDYKVHSALDHFMSTPDYHIKKGVVLSFPSNGPPGLVPLWVPSKSVHAILVQAKKYPGTGLYRGGDTRPC